MIYRLYYIYDEYVQNGVYDEDGYYDDYYDEWIEHEITIGYFASKESINKWISQHYNKDEHIVEIAGEQYGDCWEEDLVIEEIGVIE